MEHPRTNLDAHIGGADAARSFVAASREEILRRAAGVRDGLSHCVLCERRCGADRREGVARRGDAARAPCGLGEATHCFKRHVSFGEEAELLPSYMVYFAGCNFRCAFCVQAPECFDPGCGPRVVADELANECVEAVAHGARTVNVLGGEPSLHLHTILELAAAGLSLRGEPLPLVLNSNFYMTPEVIDQLEGVVTLYLADFKFGQEACAKTIAGVDRYWEVVTRNLLHARDQCEKTGARLLVRHLVMPGHVECCTRPVVAWMRERLPEVPFHVMDGYVPAWRAQNHPMLGRFVNANELAAVAELRVSAPRRGTPVALGGVA
jgi:putative pyruvate formate lyase activating enzyme